MGRGKIEIKKIENANSRQVTFSKRRAGLMKKAHELGVLCDAEVAVIIFSNTGKLFEHASAGKSMQQILAKYSKFADPSKSPTDEPMLEGPKEEDILKKEIVELEKQQSQLLGKDLIGLGLKELKDIEQKLNESLLSIKERKEQILIGQLELSRLQEQRALDENLVLRTKIAELKPLSTLVPVDHHPTEGEDLSANQCPDKGFDGAVEHDDTDLRLGFSSLAYKKREPTEASVPKITGAQKRKRRTRCTINDYQRK